mmetsp:Transcript_364/g.614  ORF Transcript_364/g.614 Transcript_364/m.614 type:complete len:225 (-) Transcript_364:450-1124(-)
MHGIKHVQVAFRIIVLGYLGCLQLFQCITVLFHKFFIGLERMLFDGLVQIICQDRVEQIRCHNKPIITKGNMLGHEAILKPGITAQLFHNEQMMQFVPRFGKMYLHILGPSPLPQGFIQVQNTQIGKVRHPSNRFECIKTRITPIERISGKEYIKNGILDNSYRSLVKVGCGLRQRRAKLGRGRNRLFCFLCQGWLGLVLSTLMKRDALGRRRRSAPRSMTFYP